MKRKDRSGSRKRSTHHKHEVEPKPKIGVELSIDSNQEKEVKNDKEVDKPAEKLPEKHVLD